MDGKCPVKMETFTNVLLVTANVGSLFENVGEIQNGWLQELYKTVHKCKPQFIALHFQEVGGKNYMVNMDQAKSFFWNIKSSNEMKDFDRVCTYVDNKFQAEDSFTALGSMYLIHKTLKNIYQYDFNVKEYQAVVEQDYCVDFQDRATTVEKEKFPKNFWPNFKWSRKGFMRTRWMIHNQELDLVNVHLFHDASNLAACKSSPSIYSDNRKKALNYIIRRLSDNRYTALPFFLFGDFNFRLDTFHLVKHLSTDTDVQKVTKDNSNELKKLVYKKRNNDHQVLLQIEDKLFVYLHQAVFREDNGEAFLKHDKEVEAFHDVVTEEDIKFPPSYPYSEDYTQPTQYMSTRCPAWCDRVLMSHTAQDLIIRSADPDEKPVVYNAMGSNVCMGDHKPVFLFFSLKTDNH